MVYSSQGSVKLFVIGTNGNQPNLRFGCSAVDAVRILLLEIFIARLIKFEGTVQRAILKHLI